MQILQSDRVLFMAKKGVVDNKFHRFRKMTSKEQGLNPSDEEYNYVDQETAETEVTSYSPEISYEFNGDDEVKAQEPIMDIYENERLGDDAVVTGTEVWTKKSIEGHEGKYKAYKRDFTVIPDTFGGDPGPMIYSGTLKAKGKKIWGYATTDDNFETVTFTEGQPIG